MDNHSAFYPSSDDDKPSEVHVALLTFNSRGYVEEENGHSLPCMEEARTQGVLAAGGSYSRSRGISLKGKRRIAVIGFVLCVLILVIGLSLGTSANTNKNRMQKSKSTTINNSTSNPPLSNNESRFRQVSEFLSIRVTELSVLQNVTTPQYRAATWIADKDEAQLPLPKNPTSYKDSFQFVQRYILAVFYYALDGENWRTQMHFLTSKSVCDWNLDLNPNSAPKYADTHDWKLGVQCTDNAVSKIYISGNDLSGEIPRELGDLLDLTHLSLFMNSISGSLQPAFKYWQKLEFFAIESNLLSGKLPDWISEWTSLRYMAMGENDLTGTLPNMQGLAQLQELSLESNNLEGDIIQIGNLGNIRKLYLNDNNFNDTIDDRTFKNLANLEVIDLSFNEFLGYFPAHFYNLVEVVVHENDLNRKGLPMVSTSSTVSPLRYLSVYGNGIPSQVPSSIGLLSSLEYLDLSRNALTGVITDTFNGLVNLKSLYLSRNPFTKSPIPEVRNLSNLEALSMTETSRNGALPDWMCTSFPKMLLLDLHHNALTGTIPPSIDQLSSLKYLSLNHNQLQGNIPTQLANLQNIISLLVHSNKLTGSLNPVCRTRPKDLAFIISDCDSEVWCSCCDRCCRTGDVSCAYADANMDTLNERRSGDSYIFSEDRIFLSP